MTEDLDSTGSREKEFDIVYEIARQNRAGSLDFIFKHGTYMTFATGLILGAGEEVVTGWNSLLRWLVCLFFILLTILHFFWLDSYRKRSSKAIRQLDQLRFIPSERYEGQRVTLWLVLSVQAYHCVLVVVICVSILAV